MSERDIGSVAKPSLKEVRRIIADQYHLFPPATIAQVCGRSVGYIRCLASAMGFRAVGRGKNHDRYFTAVEEKTLRLEYGATPIVDLAKRLRRTPAALYAKCSRMGLGRKRSAEWTPEDDEVIRRDYPTHGTTIAEQLGRTKASVRHRARKLRVRFTQALHSWRREGGETA